MKKIIVLLAMVMAFILSGCVEGNRYNYSGSSENWEVFYVVDVSDAKNVITGSIKYVGDEPPPETINYKIETFWGGEGASNVIVKDGLVSTGGHYCSGCTVGPDEEIAVEINWNGQIENLSLTNKK